MLPALLAYDRRRHAASAGAIDGREFLTCLVLGYEIATRAGIALHATVSDYHCSGAWNALGCAAVGARLLALRRRRRSREALGIAEYFGPRGQILRVCDSPTMVKDGSGWGAHAGVTAALLARDGFTGAPALTVERADARDCWERSRHALAHPRAVFQGVSGLPLGAAGGRGGARAATRAPLRARTTSSRSPSRASARRSRSGSQCRDAGDHRRGAIQPAAIRSRRRWSSADVGAAEVERRRLADPRVARLLATMTLDRGRRVLAPLSGRALGAGAHRRSPTAARSSSEPAQARGDRRESAVRRRNCETSTAS